MIIPTEYTFVCADDDEASVTVNASEHGGFLYFDSIDSDGERAIVHMRDREQVTMLRDMLTVWLSRP